MFQEMQPAFPIDPTPWTSTAHRQPGTKSGAVPTKNRQEPREMRRRLVEQPDRNQPHYSQSRPLLPPTPQRPLVGLQFLVVRGGEGRQPLDDLRVPRGHIV